MKLIPSLVLSAALVWSVSPTTAQETAAPAIPGEVGTSMGASNATMCYLAQALFGQLFDADVSTEEKLRAVVLAAGGSKGGIDTAKDHLVKTGKYFNGADAESLNALITLMETLSAEAQALVDHLKAKSEGGTNEAAIAEFKSKRATVAKDLVEFGFPLEMVE
ncbi:MAG: hypothetical protein CMO55_08875 [Verrucomicrobiales bacterium]|nr:hypothetical protein [Verrucomicrobiales bacterium]